MFISEDWQERDEYLLQRARELRQDMTPEERRLWYQFLRRSPVHWYRQRVIGDYIVDFYCHSARLAVELDGSQHSGLDGRYADQVRDRILEEAGIRVLRYSNRDVNFRFRSVCEDIRRSVRERS